MYKQKNVITLSGKLLMTLSLTWFLSACGTTSDKAKTTTNNPRPTAAPWLFDNPSDFPLANYIVGRGQAASLEQAQERARADIAKQLKVDISATTTSRTEVAVATAQNVSSETVQQDSSQDISSRSKLTISGVEIVKTAELSDAERNNRYAALAVLNKRTAAAALEKQYQMQHESSVANSKTATEQTAVLAKIALLQDAVAAEVKKQEIADILNTLRGGQAMATDNRVVTLHTQIADLRSQITARLITSGDAIVNEPAQTALAKSKIKATDNADYIIKVHLNLDEIMSRNQQFFRTGNLTAEVRQGQQLLGGCRWVLRRVAGSETFVNLLISQNVSSILNRFFEAIFSGKFNKECV